MRKLLYALALTIGASTLIPATQAREVVIVKKHRRHYHHRHHHERVVIERR
jgi:hypothetical protein